LNDSWQTIPLCLTTLSVELSATETSLKLAITDTPRSLYVAATRLRVKKPYRSLAPVKTTPQLAPVLEDCNARRQPESFRE
jgi:hypothetical protein